MERRLETMRAEDSRATLRYQWCPMSHLGASQARGRRGPRTRAFSTNEGFDWEAIQKAMAKKREARKVVVAGASTISQQLAKNLFLSGERSWLRKAQEAAIHLMLERTMSKRRILELYLNVCRMGAGRCSAPRRRRATTSAYRPPRSREHCAWLAVILPSPGNTSADA